MALKDMTKGDPMKVLFWFSIPLIIGNIFQELYNFIDTLIVGRFLGVNALAAVGSTGFIGWFFLGFIQGMTVGFSIVISKYFGAHNIKGVKKSTAQSIYLCFIWAIILTVLSVYFTDHFLKILNTPQEIYKDAHDYIKVLFWGTFANFFYNMIANVIRATGDSKTPLVFLSIAMILNIILDIIFITIFNMGVSGAALATVISQFVSGFLCLIYVKYKLPILHLSKEEMKLDKKIMIDQLKIGFPMGFQKSILTIGLLAIQGTLNQLGTEAIAAFSAASKIRRISGTAIMTLGTTASVYTAQNSGAKQFRRIRNGMVKCLKMAFLFSVFSCIFIYFFHDYLIKMFIVGDYPNIFSLSTTYLKIVIPFYFTFGVLLILRSILQGLGYSFFTLWSGVIEFLMRIIAAVILGKHFGFVGICFADPLAWIGGDIILIIGYFIYIKKATYVAKRKVKISIEKLLSISQTT